MKQVHDAKVINTRLPSFVIPKIRHSLTYETRIKDAVNMEDLICLLATVRTLELFGNNYICLSCLKQDERNTRIHVLPGSRFSHTPVDLKVHGLIFCFI